MNATTHGRFRSRLAYDLESVASPVLAAALLTLISFHSLFAATALGFVVSAALVLSVSLPSPMQLPPMGIYERTTRGIRIYLATPRLRGLLAITFTVSAAGAMVIVNTVVLVQGAYGLSQRATALALAVFGAGSMLSALLLPRLLDRVADRVAMLAGGSVLVLGLFAGMLLSSFHSLLFLWFVLGLGYSLVQTPSGRLLRKSAHAEDRPAIFAAHFALSHACWLITYPAAGWLGTAVGFFATFGALAIAAAASLALALWPVRDPETIEHIHVGLPVDHAHLADSVKTQAGYRHAHSFVIDSIHPEWPRPL